jgi:hypothetical protein
MSSLSSIPQEHQQQQHQQHFVDHRHTGFSTIDLSHDDSSEQVINQQSTNPLITILGTINILLLIGIICLLCYICHFSSKVITKSIQNNNINHTNTLKNILIYNFISIISIFWMIFFTLIIINVKSHIAKGFSYLIILGIVIFNFYSIIFSISKFNYMTDLLNSQTIKINKIILDTLIAFFSFILFLYLIKFIIYIKDHLKK